MCVVRRVLVDCRRVSMLCYVRAPPLPDCARDVRLCLLSVLHLISQITVMYHPSGGRVTSTTKMFTKGSRAQVTQVRD
jgi:hypothetical protein